MVKVFSLVFLFLGSLLHAHEGLSGHMHFLGTLHFQDVIVVGAGLLITVLIYRNVMASR